MCWLLSRLWVARRARKPAYLRLDKFSLAGYGQELTKAVVLQASLSKDQGVLRRALEYSMVVVVVGGWLGAFGAFAGNVRLPSLTDLPSLMT